MTIQEAVARPGWTGSAQRSRRLRLHAGRHALEAGVIGRQAAPIIAAGALNVAISLTDTAMMAWLDPQALAGGAVVSDLYSIAFYFATGVLAAVTPLSAAAIGAGDPRKVGVIVTHATMLLALLAAAGYWVVSSSVDLLGSLGVALPRSDAAAEYAGYMASAFVFMLVFALGRSTLAALGRGRPPMAILVLAVPLNALGNYTLMFGAFGAPEMGLAGAGAASLIVAIFAAGSTIGYALLARGLQAYGFGIWPRRIEPQLLVRIARTGLMIAVAAVAETGVFLSSTIMVGIVAAEALPAHALVFRVLGLSYSVIVGFGQAVTVRIAVAYGGADGRREQLARRTSELLALALAASYLAAFWAMGPTLASSLASDSAEARQVVAQASLLMPYAGIALAALTLGATSNAILRARAEVSVPAILTIAGYWLVGFTTIIAATQYAGRGGEGVWLGLCVGSIAAAGASWAYRAWRHGRSSEASATPRICECP